MSLSRQLEIPPNMTHPEFNNQDVSRRTTLTPAPPLRVHTLQYTRGVPAGVGKGSGDGVSNNESKAR